MAALSFCSPPGGRRVKERTMHSIIYLIGLVVVIAFILSLFGLA